MLEILRTGKHVLKTSDQGIEIMTFNRSNDLVARFPYDTRQDAIKALEQMKGGRVTLRPMQTEQAELAEIELPETIEE